MNCTDVEIRDGVEVVYVHGATVSLLSPFLNPNVPWVWILGHTPCGVDWQEHVLPLNENDDQLRASYRLLSYDLMLETARFLEIAPKLEAYGLDLIQSYKKMPCNFPDAFYLRRCSLGQRRQILLENSVFLEVFLPHAVETAQVLCLEPGYLATRLPV